MATRWDNYRRSQVLREIGWTLPRWQLAGRRTLSDSLDHFRVLQQDEVWTKSWARYDARPLSSIS